MHNAHGRDIHQQIQCTGMCVVLLLCVCAARVKRSAETRGNAREIGGIIFIAVSRAISQYTVQKPCNSAVFFQDGCFFRMETISACL